MYTQGKMNEFHAMANKVLMIKRANPVVFKVQRTKADNTIEYEDKKIVDMIIAEYF